MKLSDLHDSDKEILERARNRFLQFKFFCEKLGRAPGSFTELKICKSSDDVKFMIQNIDEDVYFPKFFGVHCEYVWGFRSYDEWKYKYFKPPLPTHHFCCGPFVRMMLISQGNGTVWLLDFYQFDQFPYNLRKVFLDNEYVSFWFAVQDAQHALHRTFKSVPPLRTRFKSNTVDDKSEDFFCLEWNCFDIKKRLQMCDYKIFRPFSAKYELMNCFNGMFGPVVQNFAESKLNPTPRLTDLQKNSSSFNTLVKSAIFVLDIGIAYGRLGGWPGYDQCDSPVVMTSDFQLINHQQETDLSLFFSNHHEYRIGETFKFVNMVGSSSFLPPLPAKHNAQDVGASHDLCSKRKIIKYNIKDDCKDQHDDKSDRGSSRIGYNRCLGTDTYESSVECASVVTVSDRAKAELVTEQKKLVESATTSEDIQLWLSRSSHFNTKMSSSTSKASCPIFPPVSHNTADVQKSSKYYEFQ